MASINCSISIDKELVTHFSVYKIISLYWNGMLTTIFAFSLVEKLPNFVEIFILNVKSPIQKEKTKMVVLSKLHSLGYRFKRYLNWHIYGRWNWIAKVK